MALSRVIATGDGSTDTFAVVFALGYLKEADVKARVGNEVDGGGSPVYRTITWLSPTLAKISGTPPGIGVQIIFERTLPRNVLLVNYEDQDIINEENMNTAQKQALMLIHELADGRFSALNENLNMGGFRIQALGTPVLSTDAATKAYVDSNISDGAANAAIAVAAASAASTSAGNAATSENNALTYRNDTFGARNAALAAMGDAETARDWAYKWSSENEDVAVNDGVHSGYSAYHWMKKAQAAVGTVVNTVAGLSGTVSDVALKAALQISTVNDTDFGNKLNNTFNNIANAANARTALGLGYANNTERTAHMAAIGIDTSGALGDVFYRDSNGQLAKLSLGSAGRVLGINSAGNGLEYKARAPDIILKNLRNTNTGGGTATGSWTRDTLGINYEARDVNNECSLASSLFTLAAGTWYIRAWTALFATDSAQLLLYNTTDASIVAVDGNVEGYPVGYAYFGGNYSGHIELAGTFTIAAGKALALQCRAQTASGNGYGVAANTGSSITHQIVELTRIG